MTRALDIHFFGHAAFGLVGLDDDDRELAVLLDPYEPGGFGGLMGYPPIGFAPDVLLHSHEHADHAHVAPFPGRPVLGPPLFARPQHTWPEPARSLAEALHLETLEVDHDAWGGTTRGGQSWMMALTLSGLRVVHAGDIGELPEQDRLDRLATGGVDLLLLPCGGFFTLGGAEAAELARRLGARVIIPMHTRTEACRLPELDDGSTLLLRFREVRHASSPVRVFTAQLPLGPAVLQITPPSEN